MKWSILIIVGCVFFHFYQKQAAEQTQAREREQAIAEQQAAEERRAEQARVAAADANRIAWEKADEEARARQIAVQQSIAAQNAARAAAWKAANDKANAEMAAAQNRGTAQWQPRGTRLDQRAVPVNARVNTYVRLRPTPLLSLQELARQNAAIEAKQRQLESEVRKLRYGY
jgi:hypothetical protein